MNSLRWYVFAAAVLACSGVCEAGERQFSDYFIDRVLRVDYYHTGTKSGETISLDEVYEEGAWPGSQNNLIDTLNLGEYLLQVFDWKTRTLLYSRGFSSIFTEWQSTEEAAAGISKTFSETVRIPFPKRAVQVTISRRDRHMVFHEMFASAIDPNGAGRVNRTRKASRYTVVPLMENGAPAEKVDIVILGDGYSKGDMEKFRRDAKHLNDVMFSTSPFKERMKDFNVRTIEVESGDSGIDIPDRDVWKNNSLGCCYTTFGLPRYVLTTENKSLRDIASAVPYDCICILINDSRYGGGGIYNLYTTTYTDEKVKEEQWQSDYMYVHEFGHSFAGLADEYYTTTVAVVDFYLPGVEPWEPNVTAMLDKANLKWKQYLTPGIEIPTRWEKAPYDSIWAIHAKLDRLAPEYYEERKPLFRASAAILKRDRNGGKVGAFEGAGYASKGLYRPSLDCRMFSLSLAGFDPVCSAAIERVINFYAH
jgi:hypothetical protein